MLFARSSCECTLRRADWRRFWPLLFLYGAGWMIGLPLGLWNMRHRVANADSVAVALRRVEDYIFGCSSVATVVSGVFAVLLAMTLYGYLMNSRSVGLMHAFPINRTKQFFHHFLVGIELFTTVHVAVAAVALLVQAGLGVVSWGATLTWFAVAELTGVFFFALATVCAMVTGWVLAVPIIYAGVNAMFVAFYALLSLMFELFYWGYSSADLPAAISWLTPFYRLPDLVSDSYHYNYALDMAHYQLTPEAWKALIVYAVVGVAFMVVAWRFYKARRSESAGDAIVFNWLRPIVLYVMSVVGGMGFGFLLYYLLGLDGSEAIVMLLICQIIAGVVVYFAVEMLLQKSFKVFNRRGWLGAVLLAVILIVIGAVVKFDLFGYEHHVPAEEKIVSVELNGTYLRDYVYADAEIDPEVVEKITALHRAIVTQGPDDSSFSGGIFPTDAPYDPETDTYCHFNVYYNFTDGTRMRRNYHLTVKPGSDIHKAMNDLINAEGVLAQSYYKGYDDDYPVEELTGGYYYNHNQDKYDSEIVIDAETGAVIAAETAPVKEQQLSAAQAQALYRAVGQHLERMSRERVDVMAYYRNYCTFNLEFRGEVWQNESGGVDYDNIWNVYNLPASCTEVLDLLIEFGFAESYDELVERNY